jgi:hypothetical protein
MVIDEYRGRLGLYGWPFSMLFDRRLHFMACLTIAANELLADGPFADGITSEQGQASLSELCVSS